jgi:hypothetical protein
MMLPLALSTYRRHQSLEYIEAKSWRLELGDVAAD